MKGPDVKRSEFWSAMILLPLHCVLFPLLIPQLPLLQHLSAAEQNLLYYCVSCLLTFLLLGKLLRRDFDRFLDRFFRCLFVAAGGLVLYELLQMAVNYGMGLWAFGVENLNDGLLREMAQTDRKKLIVMTVFLAPVIEECIFRAGLFGGLTDRGVGKAYAVSMLVFALYHVWQSALLNWDARYLLLGLQYLPGGFALCFVYHKSDSIWTSILLHMAINLLGIMAM